MASSSKATVLKGHHYYKVAGIRSTPKGVLKLVFSASDPIAKQVIWGWAGGSDGTGFYGELDNKDLRGDYQLCKWELDEDQCKLLMFALDKELNDLQAYRTTRQEVRRIQPLLQILQTNIGALAAPKDRAVLTKEQEQDVFDVRTKVQTLYSKLPVAIWSALSQHFAQEIERRMAQGVAQSEEEHALVEERVFSEFLEAVAAAEEQPQLTPEWILEQLSGSLTTRVKAWAVAQLLRRRG